MNEFQKRPVFVNILMKYYSYVQRRVLPLKVKQWIIFQSDLCIWLTIVVGWFSNRPLCWQFSTATGSRTQGSLGCTSCTMLAQVFHYSVDTMRRVQSPLRKKYDKDVYLKSWSYSVITDHIQFTQCRGYCTTAHCIRYSPLFSRHNVRGPLNTEPGTITFSCHS